MQLADLLKKELVNADIKARTKKAVLAELVDIIIQSGIKLDQEAVVQVLLQREKLGSTGIGQGIAIPHGKINNINDLIVAFGRSHEGVDFESMDGKPAHIFFLLLAPENSAGKHLKALAKISKMLKMDNFRKALLEAKSQDDLYKLIIDQDDACIV
ncbi:MAG TPA: PTS sugar transporter subunit IIA [Smithellaceae bacterium]|nr:PTS sugar transporter subunit IIA [Smithellaceae bacterium]